MADTTERNGERETTEKAVPEQWMTQFVIAVGQILDLNPTTERQILTLLEERHAAHCKPQPEKVAPSLEEWMQSVYEGADLDKLEIPARVCIQIAESYAAHCKPQAPATRKIDGKFSTNGTRIFNTVSGQEIPEDEPLFLLRARDWNAMDALQAYQESCSRDCNDLHQAGIRQVIEKFKNFRLAHPGRMKQPGITKHLKLEATPQGTPDKV